MRQLSPRAMNIAAFNLGNAIGAALGGAVIGAVLGGYPALSLNGAAMAAGALGPVLLLQRRTQRLTCPAE
jgi:DHA1 family inner membrane transport protein